MDKYTWDINYLANLKHQFKIKLFNSEDEETNLRYSSVIDQIDILMSISLMSGGEIINSKVRGQELLDSFRRQKSIDDYSGLVPDLMSKTVPLFNQFDRIKNSKYSAKLNIHECVYLLGDIIKEVFDEEHYNTYKKYVIDGNHFIQVSNLVEAASISTITSDDKDYHFMLLPDKNNFILFSNLVHEVGHLFRLTHNDTSPLLDDKLYEFESYYYQVKILEYCIENDIYRNDAIIALLDIFKDIERVAILLDSSYRFNLQNQFNIGTFKEICAKIDLYDKTGVNNTLELLEYLSYIHSRNILNYIYSFLAVLEVKDRDDEVDVYNHIVTNIGKISSDEYVYNIFDDPITFNGLDKYKKYRSKILGLTNR